MDLFIGTFPNAYVYCDKETITNGDYHQIGMVVFNPLKIVISDKSSKYAYVHKQMQKDYEYLKTQTSVVVSTTGQTAAIRRYKWSE